MKKYRGGCRWWPTRTRKMMVAFPITVVRYMSRRTRERNSCSLWSSPEKPSRMNSVTAVAFSGPVINFSSPRRDRNMAKNPSVVIPQSGWKVLSFSAFSPFPQSPYITQRVRLTPWFLCFTFLLEASEKLLSSFYLFQTLTKDCFSRTEEIKEAVSYFTPFLGNSNFTQTFCKHLSRLCAKLISSIAQVLNHPIQSNQSCMLKAIPSTFQYLPFWTRNPWESVDFKISKIKYLSCDPLLSSTAYCSLLLQERGRGWNRDQI